MNRPLLRLAPVFQEKIWGGARLQTVFHYPIPSNRTGECWAHQRASQRRLPHSEPGVCRGDPGLSLEEPPGSVWKSTGGQLPPAGEDHRRQGGFEHPGSP